MVLIYIWFRQLQRLLLLLHTLPGHSRVADADFVRDIAGAVQTLIESRQHCFKR